MGPAEIQVDPVPNCPLCSSPGGARFDDVDEWRFRACQTCDTLWLDPRPNAASLHALYPPDYATHYEPVLTLIPRSGLIGSLRCKFKIEMFRVAWGYTLCSGSVPARAAAVCLARIPWFRNRAGRSIRFVRARPGRLLDVGCGNGEYLLLMQALGWQVQGIEPDPRAAETALRSGLDVISLPLESVQLTPRSFDVITLHHVLEHLADPRGAFEVLSEALRPGGQLVVVVPNPSGVLARCLRSRWRGLDPPRHFVLLSPAALRNLAESAHFDCSVRTLCRNTRSVAQASWQGPGKALVAWVFSCLGVVVRVVFVYSGEEIVLQAWKRDP